MSDLAGTDLARLLVRSSDPKAAITMLPWDGERKATYLPYAQYWMFSQKDLSLIRTPIREMGLACTVLDLMVRHSGAALRIELAGKSLAAGATLRDLGAQMHHDLRFASGRLYSETAILRKLSQQLSRPVSAHSRMVCFERLQTASRKSGVLTVSSASIGAG